MVGSAYQWWGQHAEDHNDMGADCTGAIRACLKHPRLQICLCTQSYRCLHNDSNLLEICCCQHMMYLLWCDENTPAFAAVRAAWLSMRGKLSLAQTRQGRRCFADPAEAFLKHQPGSMSHPLAHSSSSRRVICVQLTQDSASTQAGPVLCLPMGSC